MTQEQKDLLLKDLCARLPYDVIFHYHWERKGTIADVVDVDRKLDFSDVESLKYLLTELQDNRFIIEWKPYLRPLSSITEKEKEEIKPLFSKFTDESGKRVLVVRQNKMTLYQDWLNAHHFDYRGLIPMDLAIEVTEKNNPYK